LFRLNLHFYQQVLERSNVSGVDPSCNQVDLFACFVFFGEVADKIPHSNNIGIFGTGYWSIVIDLSTHTDVPYPRRWTDLVDPLYRDLVTVHGYNGKASIANLLMLLKEKLGNNAATDFARNIRNV